MLDFDMHKKFHQFSRELNHFYLESSELWEQEDGWDGFQWIEPDDSDHNIIAFRRINKKGDDLIVACNFSPVTRENYRIGVMKPGIYKTVFHSGLQRYGGSLPAADTEIRTEDTKHNNYEFSLKVDLTGLSTIFWRCKKCPTQRKRK